MFRLRFSRSLVVTDTIAHVTLSEVRDAQGGARIGPGPGGLSLELEIECFSGEWGASDVVHTVTVHSDWSVVTPHDREAERIAEAFGSYTSCVTHMERTVAAFRASLSVLTRETRLPLSPGRDGTWQVREPFAVPGCCLGTLFGGVAAAAEHTRSSAHLARQHGVSLGHIESFLSAAAATWGRWERAPLVSQDIQRLVRPPAGVDDLWRAGIHPDEIPSLANVGSAVDGPLPLSFFVGLAYGNADHQWLREVLAYRPDDATAAWLVWLDQPHERASSAEWGSWLGLGVSDNDVVTIVKAGVSAGQVQQIASSNSWPARAVAAEYVKWAKTGCALRAEHLHALKRHGIYAPKPSSRAIDSLCDAIANTPGLSLVSSQVCLSRTDLAVMLEILGNERDVLQALRRGVRDMAHLDGYLKARN